MKYRADIDGLRAFAVLSVVIYHAFPASLRGGFVGVDIFFVISGYLITRIILEEIGEGKFSFLTFYKRRIKRIFPALILVMLASLTFGWFSLFAAEFKQLSDHITSGAAFVLNFVLVNEAGYFDNATETKPMLHLWSLAVEEQYYLIWPVVLWLAWKKKINLLKLTIIIAIVSFCLNFRFVYTNPVETFFWPIGRFWELLAGSILICLSRQKKNSLALVKKRVEGFSERHLASARQRFTAPLMMGLMSLCGVLLLVASVVGLHEQLSFPGVWAILPVSGAILVIAAGPNAWMNRYLLSNKIAVWFGLISYPLYLWHWPILSFLQIVEGATPPFTTRVIAILLSIGLSWLTVRFVERPIRFGTNHTMVVQALVVAMVIVGSLSYFISYNDGLASRSSIARYETNSGELKRTVAVEDGCTAFLGIETLRFNYCRFLDGSHPRTVAVIGDSHAHAAFPGIARGLEPLGYNTLLMANSSCPPFIDSPWGRNEEARRECAARIEQILTHAQSLKDVSIVLLFSRGPTYWTGTEPASPEIKPVSLGKDAYFAGLQRTIDYLEDFDKRVVYITENPELAYQAVNCLPRPFKNGNSERCITGMDEVLERQADYVSGLSSLNSVDVISSLPAFCPGLKNCIAVNDDMELLYADDNHLSITGSIVLFEKVIQPFLKEQGLLATVLPDVSTYGSN